MRVSYRRLHPNESGVKEGVSAMVSRICIDMVEPSVRSSLTCVETSALNKHEYNECAFHTDTYTYASA